MQRSRFQKMTFQFNGQSTKVSRTCHDLTMKTDVSTPPLISIKNSLTTRRGRLDYTNSVVFAYSEIHLLLI